VEKLVNRQAEEGENSNREWVFPKDNHLKAGRRRDEELKKCEEESEAL
jgi:hypothetical protein